MTVVDHIDLALLRIACPENSSAELSQWVDPIRSACKRWGIDTVREVAAFLAQGAHESHGFTHLEENLNYTAKRLSEVWPKRFPTIASGAIYSRDPQRLANYVYANRMGNGPETTGDGWRFRGAGIFQLTGRSNHTLFGAAMGIPLTSVPAYIRTKIGAAMSAGWFWKTNKLDALAATPGVEDETRRINGGTIGLADRKQRFDRLVTELLRRGC